MSSKSNSKRKIKLTDLINYTIDDITIIEPYIVTIDYENSCFMDGNLLFYLKNQDTTYLLKVFFNHKHYKDPHNTSALQLEQPPISTASKSTNINSLKKQKIINIEKIIVKKTCCFTRYYYQLSLDNKLRYKLYLNHYKIKIIK